MDYVAQSKQCCSQLWQQQGYSGNKTGTVQIETNVKELINMPFTGNAFAVRQVQCMAPETDDA